MQRKLWLFVTGVLFLMTSAGVAQIDRVYEPVVIVGENIPDIFHKEINHLYLFVYDAAGSSWRLIPFQIDEADTTKKERKYFAPEKNEALRGIFDFDDELVFMANDLGDRADSTNWVENADSMRCEIELLDPISGEKRYVYLFYLPNNILDIPAPYELAYDALNDLVSSSNYQVGFDHGAPDTMGLLSDVWIKSGTGVEIFDRVKVRLHGLVTLLFPLPVTLAESYIRFDSVNAKIGPVRILRNMEANFSFVYGSLSFPPEEFPQTSFFYPWHGFYGLSFPVEDFRDYGDILYARLSWDMNQNAVGMHFYSENNTGGVLVDGNGNHDGIVNTCRPNDLNWAMVSGAQGTMMNVFYVPQLGSTQGIFYFDNTDSDILTTGDDNVDKFITDTGDNVAYGDCGYFIYDKNNIDVVHFDLIYYNFFMPPTFTPDMANQLTEQLRRPLTIATKVEKFVSTTALAELGFIQDEFDLYQNYPNPFNASTMISFSLIEPQRVSLIIYDLIGKQVREIESAELAAGIHQYVWDGKNDINETVTTGLYLYKLKTDKHVSTRKLLFVK